MRHFITAALLALLSFQGCSKKDNSEETHTEQVQTIDPALTTLDLEIKADDLPENKETAVAVTAADGKDVTSSSGIIWHFNKPNVIEINGTKLTAKAEGTTTVRAEFNGQYSQEQNVTVYKIIHGHRLPPEPDPKINNSTLLGIDSNHNGVRDDVERWIYETYQDKHPIYIDIAMQSGRAWQKVLEDPTQAKEIHAFVKAPQYCNWYFQVDVKDFGKQPLVDEDIYSRIKARTFNTTLRENAYLQYDNLLSGDSYTVPRRSQRKALCDFNTSKYEE